MEVIVVGGGIAGLTMALSLHQAGIPVRVYEAVRDLVPLGVGINLQPIAVRELTELRLADELARSGTAIHQWSLFNKFGQLIWIEKRALSAGYKWAQYAIRRGHLQSILLQAVRDRIGEGHFRSGLRFADFEQHRDRVAARFSDSRSGARVIDEADVLIGADGIHSAVRRQLYPAVGRPQFAQQVLWRGAVDAEPFLDGRTMVIAGHFHQRIVVYPMAHAARGGHLLTNWICQTIAPGLEPSREDWNRRVSKDKVLATFGAWRFPWLDMPALIERTADIYEFPLVDRDPVASWTFGRITLIGDAAHPMQPIGSQAVGCNIQSSSGTTVRDQLIIVLRDSEFRLDQIVHIPAPIIYPTSWNANEGFSVVAINNPTFGNVPNVLGMQLQLMCDVSVKNAS